MNRQDWTVVFDSRGQRGRTDLTQLTQREQGTAQVLVQFEGYAPVLVAQDMLSPQADGSYVLPYSVTELTAQGAADMLANTTVFPVIEETIQIYKTQVESDRLRIKKVVHEYQETVDLALMTEEIEVRRVPINQIVAGPAAMRQEGDTLIVPVYEEVVVVQKQLLLKEEVHIRKQQTEHHRPETVTLRKEEIKVERLASPDDYPEKK